MMCVHNYAPLDSWDALRERVKIDFNNSDIYDDINVEETTTAQKVMDKFSKALTLEKDAKPRVYIMKNTGVFDRAKFRIKQKKCPICEQRGESVFIDNPLISDPGGSFTVPCPKCDAAISFFVPLPLQKLIMDLNASIVNQIAGYGSGKTTVDMYIAAKMAYEIDHSHIMIGVGKDDLLEQATTELKRFFARPWKETKDKKGDFVQESKEKWTLKNGSIIRFISANAKGSSPEDLRSWNFNAAILVEASNENFFRGGDKSYFGELLGRMRAPTGSIVHYDEDGNETTYLTDSGDYKPFIHGTLNTILLESNPTPSELIPQIYNQSSVLIMTEKVANKEKVIKRFMERYDPAYAAKGIVTVLASSRDNPNITEEFLNTVFAGKSQAYIRRMRDADMTASEDQVYPQGLDCARQPMSTVELKTADDIYHGFDPGLDDPSGILYAAFWKNYKNTGKPKLRIFKSHKTKGGPAFEGNSIHEWVNVFDNIETAYGFTTRDFATNKTTMKWTRPDGKVGRIIRIADHSNAKKVRSRDNPDQKSLSDYERLNQNGYKFKNAVKGKDSIMWGIQLVKTYMDEGILEWDLTEEMLEEEFIRYMFTSVNGRLVPADVHNHLMDALRYIVIEIDVILNSLGKAPKVVSAIEEDMREAFERRATSRDRIAAEREQLDDVVDSIMSRSQIIGELGNPSRAPRKKVSTPKKSNRVNSNNHRSMFDIF